MYMVPVIKEKHNKKLNYVKGRWGESITTSFLEKEGYIILKRNFRCYFGEVDIIAFSGNIICFVEVKMRNSTKFGLGAEFVGFTKMNRIKRSAKYFFNTQVISKNKSMYIIRFDICEITRYKGIYYCRLIKNV